MLRLLISAVLALYADMSCCVCCFSPPLPSTPLHSHPPPQNSPKDITWHESNWDNPDSRFLAWTFHDTQGAGEALGGGGGGKG